MASKEIFSVWYRSVTSDGKVWCESSSFAEVIEQSEGYEVSYLKLTQILTTGNWEQIKKSELKKAKAALD